MNNKKIPVYIRRSVPCYVYRESVISAQCEMLKNTLTGFEFLYSIKANPCALIVQTAAKQGFGADAASVQEVKIAFENHMAPENIYYSAPGKREKDLRQSVGKCIVIADSFSEIAIIDKIAREQKKQAEIGLRIHPDFTMDGGSQNASKLGIDWEQLNRNTAVFEEYPNVTIIGIHIHLRSQVLNFEILSHYYHNCFTLAQKLSQAEKVNLSFINFGGGLGTVYDRARDNPIDLLKLARLTEDIKEKNRKTLQARLLIESGHFLISSAGTYYTKIVDIKQSHEKKYLVVDTAMNGFLRPAVAALLRRNLGETAIPGQDPLYTSDHAFAFAVLNEAAETEKVDIVGSLCTALDVLAENVEVQQANIGDIVSVSNAGSYGYSLSPLLFSSQEKPVQIYLSEDGKIR